MANKDKYKGIRLPEDLVEELKIWKRAFSSCYMKEVSYGEMIRMMLDNLDAIDPDITVTMDRLIERYPEYSSIVGKYKGVPGYDAEFGQ